MILTRVERAPFVEAVLRSDRVPSYVHYAKDCSGRCPYHKPSKHHMDWWPKTLRMSALVERLCRHSVGHPDPDSLAWFESRGVRSMGVHGCDGCCAA